MSWKLFVLSNSSRRSNFRTDLIGFATEIENIGMKQARKAPNSVVTFVDPCSESPFQDQIESKK